ncbi:glycosyltransferase [Mariprofundus sp. EBB-1]|uniref:glycosyltransferase n=1 Tax=Mariprofundus sp. EBB-1 TaxID=2650971 RepID=UPI000EF22FBE|nr:glycosyltransferase [Mariprofundus sp. EBB-1]RLL55874.1 glycosyltransferase [Mariprofundus sp. EBB-1]
MNQLTIVHINFTDSGGGAAMIMNELIASQTRAGHIAFACCARPTLPSSKYLGVGSKADLPAKLVNKLSVLRNQLLGDTRAFGLSGMLNTLLETKADIFHIHNIHGGWFPLSLLETLSEIAPIIWTIHDEWAYTGHCVYTLGCEKFTSGCGKCPDLGSMVPLIRDTTRKNWLLRQGIYRKLAADGVILAAVSSWTANRVSRSGIWPGKLVTINNGINKDIFYPVPKQEARSRLGLDSSSKILLCSAAGGINNPFKNISLVVSALKELRDMSDLKVVIIGGSSDLDVSLTSSSQVLSVGHINDVSVLRDYYAAADLLVYPTKADTFGLVVAEAMACGTPVLATAVGGVAEIIEDGDSGFLVKESISAAELAIKIKQIFNDPAQCSKVRENAIKRINEKFTTDLMASGYLALYQEMINKSVNMDSYK